MKEALSHSILSSVTSARWFKLALFNFLLAASIGVLLRFAFVNEIKWLNYKSFQHAHSTLALLGWGYLGFFAVILASFNPAIITERKIYRQLFVLSFTLIIISCASFVLFENKIIPNLFITLFSFLVFIFVSNFFKDTSSIYGSRSSYLYLKIALLFLCLSFLGSYVAIWAMLASGAKKILLYYLSSQFFLHFQYNGWFTFGVLGLILKFCEEKGIKTNEKVNKSILIYLFSGAILSFFISLFWGSQTKLWLLWIAALGGIIQLLPMIIYRRYLFVMIRDLSATLSAQFRIFFVLSIVCFLLKLFMQVIIIVPEIATLAFTIRNYVIAYVHLVFIGMASLFLIAWAIEHKQISVAKTVWMGLYAFVAGFILVEIVLFLQGTLLWMGKGFIDFYYPLLFLVSVLLPLGLLVVTIKNMKYLPFKNRLT